MNFILNIIILICLILIVFISVKKNNNETFENTLDLDKLKNSVVLITNYMRSIDWNNPKDSVDTGTSRGSGFFIDNTHILTNFHVVSDYSVLNIKLPNVNSSQNYGCEVLAVYPELDVALLKIKDYESQYYLELGDSDVHAEMGTKAYAVGYPLGMEQLKVSSGIINGIQDGQLQMDTPINPGNSGGPLITEDMKVIGINFAGILFAQNIGFSIPINYVKNILEDMKNNSEKPYIINKPNLGFSYSNTSEKYMDVLGLCNSGVTVDEIISDGPLDNNLKESDIICSIDDIDIDNFGKLYYNENKYSIEDYLFFKQPNSEIKLKYIRDNQINNININLENKKIEKINMIYYPFENVDYVEHNGFIFMNLTVNHLVNNIFSLKIKDGNLQFIDKGKVILTKKNIINGNLYDMNNVIRPPVIIKKINGEEVYNIQDVKNALNNYENINGKQYFTMLTEDNTYFIEEK